MWVNFDTTDVRNNLKNKVKWSVCFFSKIAAHLHKINILSRSLMNFLQVPGPTGPAAVGCVWECVLWEQQSF